MEDAETDRSVVGRAGCVGDGDVRFEGGNAGELEWIPFRQFRRPDQVDFYRVLAGRNVVDAERAVGAEHRPILALESLLTQTVFGIPVGQARSRIFFVGGLKFLGCGEVVEVWGLRSARRWNLQDESDGILRPHVRPEGFGRNGPTNDRTARAADWAASPDEVRTMPAASGALTNP